MDNVEEMYSHKTGMNSRHSSEYSAFEEPSLERSYEKEASSLSFHGIKIYRLGNTMKIISMMRDASDFHMTIKQLAEKAAMRQ